MLYLNVGLSFVVVLSNTQLWNDCFISVDDLEGFDGVDGK